MSDLVITRRSLHGVAEWLLAAPQHAESGTIRLSSTPGGFTTIASPEIRVDGGRLSYADRTVELDGRTLAEVADAVGLTPHSPANLYRDHSGLSPESVLHVDRSAAAAIAAALARGAEALLTFRPESDPVLWPEHFDVGISVDRVNFGVSPGDDFLAEPYAYVGPHDEFSGPFWNAPFGAARPLVDVPDLVGWFTEGVAAAGAAW